MPGCALLASGNAAHSHISGCVSSPGFGLVDILIGVGTAAALTSSGKVDESPAWMAVPGVFLASGVVGTIYAQKCAGDRSHASSSSAPMPDYASHVTPPTPISTLPMATPEELGLPAVDPQAATRLQLDPDYMLKHPSTPPAEGEPGSTPAPPVQTAPVPSAYPTGRIECELGGSPCPAGASCLLWEGSTHGLCIADPLH
jgi:hypothetical protein